MSENRCVCCGAIIPEGRQCCPSCVNKYMEKESKVRFDGVAVKKDGTTITKSGTLAEMTAWADQVRSSEKVKEINIRRG